MNTTPDFLAATPLGDKWKQIGIRNHHGINTPLFSLRSKNSCGIGEFLDLIPLMDWLKPLGFDVIQLLPLSATGQDPSPYNALSANALHPIYLSLHNLPHLDQYADLKNEIEKLKNYNNSEHVLYEAVRNGKETFLEVYLSREGKNIQQTPEYNKFISENPWIENFARFQTLKRLFHWKDWREWTLNFDLSPHQHEIDQHKMIQFLCYSQMQEVKKYAESKGMFIMGDIPILISPDSADVWGHPELFNQELAAGAPPDMYSKEGQSWGFPLYNYPALEKEDHHFWKERLHSASSIYHLYRIDHIVGFFRIWAIPKGKKGSEGHFEPMNQDEWVPQGKKMLTMMIENSSMLPIGEDLGVIPKETRETMHQLGIAGTKVMRWERYWERDSSYIPYDQYPLDSLTTVSTHDSEPLKLWWKIHQEEARLFAAFKHWGYTPELNFEGQFQLLKDSHHTGSAFHINLLQEYLSLFPELTWGKPDEERINLPGIVSPHNWTYKYKPSIEEMAAHPELSKKLQEIVS